MNKTNLVEANLQWANRPADQRFETLEALQKSVADRRIKSRSIDIDASKVTVTSENDRLMINGTIQPSEPTHWSFGQLSSLVKAPAGYLRTLSQKLIVDNLNYGLKESGVRNAVKFMTIQGDDKPNTLQAVTSPTYGRIWDADVVDAVIRIVERTGGKFFNPKAYSLTGGDPRPSGLYASDRDVFMFLIDGGSLLDAGPRAQLNRGFIVYNSEVGAKVFGLITFLFNKVCGNNIIWDAQQVNRLMIRHTQGGPARFDSEAAPALLEYVNRPAAPIESSIKKAQELVLGKDAQEIMDWVNKNGKFTKSEISSAIDFAKSEEGKCETLWDIVQGGTAYARGFDFVDARMDLETRFGKLLNVINN